MRINSHFFKLLLFGLSNLILISQANAVQDLDRHYSLETIGILRAWDNVDGLFGDYVDVAYKEYFSNQSRFIAIDLSKANPILSASKIPYGKLIEDDQILRAISKSMRAQTILRTRVYKEGPSYRFILDWVHLPKVQLLASDTFSLEEPKGGVVAQGEIRDKLQKALERLIEKIPFIAQISGRDGASVTVNLTDNSKISRGDTLVISTVEDVREHPLLKTVVDWRFAETGRAIVESLDGGIAFCKILEEEPKRQITRYQKITRVLPAPEEKSDDSGKAKPETQEEEARKNKEDHPEYGWGYGGLQVGGYSRDYSTGGASPQTRTGGALLIGGRALVQLWFTRDWMAEFGLGYGFSSFSQQNATTGLTTSAASVTANVLRFKADAGYNFYASKDLLGPKAWAKAGFHTSSYKLPVSSTEFTGPSSFYGPFIGLGGELPISELLGASFLIDMGFLNSAKESGYTSGAVDGSNSVEFGIGGYYEMAPKMRLRFGLEVESQSADFVGGASLSQRVMSLGAGIQVFF